MRRPQHVRNPGETALGPAPTDKPSAQVSGHGEQAPPSPSKTTPYHRARCADVVVTARPDPRWGCSHGALCTEALPVAMPPAGKTRPYDSQLRIGIRHKDTESGSGEDKKLLRRYPLVSRRQVEGHPQRLLQLRRSDAVQDFLDARVYGYGCAVANIAWAYRVYRTRPCPPARRDHQRALPRTAGPQSGDRPGRSAAFASLAGAGWSTIRLGFSMVDDGPAQGYAGGWPSVT